MNKNTPEKFDIAVVGGGISGLSMAYSLTTACPHLSLALIAPDTSSDPRTTAILRQHEAFFSAGGIWQTLKQQSQRIITVELHNGADMASFHAADIGQEYFSTNIINDTLYRTMHNLLKKKDNLTTFQALVRKSTIQPHCRMITLDDGQSIAATLVIAADGVNSTLRQQENIPVKQCTYNQTARVGTLCHALPHKQVTIEFHYEDGLLTFVPMPDSQQSALIWCKNSTVKTERTIEDIAGDRLGNLSNITLSGQYPMHFLQAQKIIAPRMAFIGETAHKVHPLGAQGVNITLSDIRTLTDIIQKHTAVGLDIGSKTALREYETSRLPAMHTRTSLLHRLAQQVGHGTYRKKELSLIDGHPMLKNLIARYGMET